MASNIDEALFECPDGEFFHGCPHAAVNKEEVDEEGIARAEYGDHDRALEDFQMIEDMHTLIIRVPEVAGLGSHHERYKRLSEITLELMGDLSPVIGQQDVLQIVQGPCYDQPGFYSRRSDSYQVILNKLDIFETLPEETRQKTRARYEAVCDFPISTFMPDPDDPNDDQYHLVFI